MGSVLGFVARVNLRRRWRGCVLFAVLVGAGLGVALGALAGARRTQSSYDQYLRDVDASTLSVAATQGFVFDGYRAVAELPQVARARAYVGFTSAYLVDGQPDFTQTSEAIGSFDGMYFDQDRFVATSGRAPDPSRPDEVAFNERAAAQSGYRVGDVVHFAVYDLPDFPVPDLPVQPTPHDVIDARVTGIGLFPDELLQDDADRTGRMLLTPAYTQSHTAQIGYGLYGLELVNGARDVDDVQDQVRTLAGGRADAAQIHDLRVDRAHARRALRPLSISLAVFGAVAGVVTIVLAAQAAGRMRRRDARDAATLRVFGAEQQASLLAALAAPVTATAGAIAVAVVAAVAMSATMPIGPVHDIGRLATGATGVDVDVAVIGCGLLVAAAVIGAVLVRGALVADRRALRPPTRVAQPSRIVAAAAASGLPPTATSGLRMTFGTGATGNEVPVRALMAGAALAIASLVVAISFAANVHTLTTTPRLYGWDWDAALYASNGYGNLDPAQTKAILDADPAIVDRSGAYFGEDQLDGRPVPLIGMDPASTVHPPITKGRMISNDDEVVLGQSTADALGVDIGGSVVPATAPDHPLRVVGIATLPTIGRGHVRHAGLGQGGIVSVLRLPGHDTNILGHVEPGAGPNAMFLRYAAGTDMAVERDVLIDATVPLRNLGGVDVIGPQRPNEIVNSSALGNAPRLVAAAFALMAAISLGIALVASVHHRRRELSILRSLGFTGQQLGTSVAWHATAVVVVGVLIGIPVGIVGGRQLWGLFSDQLDIVEHVDSMWLTAMLVGLVALVVANVIATVPARLASRVQPAALLRAVD